MSVPPLLEWLEARTPPAPAELRAHMAGRLQAAAGAPVPADDASAVAEALFRACEASLDSVLMSGDAGRCAALDLLSADAFVTYAFEAVADDPGRVSDLADIAMRRISDRAAPYLATGGTS